MSVSSLWNKWKKSDKTPLAKPLPRFLKIGFVGKRDLSIGSLSFSEGEKGLEESLTDLICEIDSTCGNMNLVGVSSLAIGADMMFAQVMREKGCLQHLYLPDRPEYFFNEADFNQEQDEAESFLSWDNVIEVKVSSCNSDRRERFAETALEIVDTCDVLIAVIRQDEADRLQEWKASDANTKEQIEKSLRRGGTLETLIYAIKTNQTVYTLTGTQDGKWESSNVSGSLEKLPCMQTDNLDHVCKGQADPLGGFDYVEALQGIKKRASHVAKQKWSFVRITMAILIIHVLATTVASVGIIYSKWLSHHADVGFGWLKIALLVSGLLLALGMHFLRGRFQTRWVRARLIAEIARSSLVFAGDSKKGVFPLPSAMSHLRSFHIPELKGFVCSIQELHLLEVKRSQRKETKASFGEFYIQDRIEGQITYFADKHDQSERQIKWCERIFFCCSSIALLGAITAISLSHDLVIRSFWLLLACKLVPIVFPVLAAAFIVVISVLDLGRRTGTYKDMAEILESYKNPIKHAATEASLIRDIQELEHKLLQENVEAYSSMKNLRAG